MTNPSILSVLPLVDKKNWGYLTLQENLTRCYEKKIFVDAVVKIRDNIFQAHKTILSFYSPVFWKMFYEMKIPSSTCIVNDVTPQGFDILLRYLYCSEIPNEVDSDGFLEACFAAQVLEMVGITEKMVNHFLLKTTMRKRNSGERMTVQFWSLLKKCRSLRFLDMQKKLLNFAESHFISVFYDNGFAEADSESIRLVLNKKPPAIPERYVLEIIAQWKESNVNLESSDHSFPNLLNCVDFKRLTAKEFCAVASKHDRLLPEKDSLDILMHLVDPTVFPLPHWCQLDGKGLNTHAHREKISEIDKYHSSDNLYTNTDSSLKEGNLEKMKTYWKSQEDLRRRVDNLNKRYEKKSCTVADSCGKTLQEIFYYMLKKEMFTDVTLIAKDGTEIPAHGLVLALGSQFFADVFYWAVPTSKALLMEETDEDVKHMLRYFYGCGKSVHESSLDSILRKTDMALKYLCYPLMQDCEKALVNIPLEPGNFWTVIDWSLRLSHSKVDTKALLLYAATSTKEVFEHESFLGSSKASLVWILKSNYLNLGEGDILEHVARWMEVNKRELPTDISRKELFKNIRLQALNPGEFLTFLQKHDGLFPIRDSYAVLEFLFRRRDADRLPAWCYSGPMRSVFYDPSKKIGTNIPLLSGVSPLKAHSVFTCAYKIVIKDKRTKSEVQFLELSLQFNTLELFSDCTSSVTITTGDRHGDITFYGLKISPDQRYLVPVSFCLDSSQRREIHFVLMVDVEHPCTLNPVCGRSFECDNVVFVAGSTDTNFLCDAIVDGFTSENVRIPKHLLYKHRNAAVRSEDCFKIKPAPTA